MDITPTKQTSQNFKESPKPANEFHEKELNEYLEEVKKGKDVTEVTDSSGRTLLHIALNADKTQVVEYLLDLVFAPKLM